jgi:hypothetical protein
MRGIIDPQTQIGPEINRRMDEGLSTIDRTILSTKSVVYRACQTKQRTSSKGRAHERLSLQRRSCEVGNPPRNNLVSEQSDSRRLCAVVCIVGRRLQSDFSDADSLGLFKALGYCAECA